MPTLLLVDNGSRRADATRALREIAARLSSAIGHAVAPVSLLHSSRVDPAELDGRPADTFEPFLRRRFQAGERHFIVVPLFFGASQAITDFIPERVAALRQELGWFGFSMAPTLCPLPGGEPRLVAILADQLARLIAVATERPDRIILVDHGSPLARVAAVRQWLARGLRERMGAVAPVDEAAMERRAGTAYDFNGALLEDALHALGARGARHVLLSMLFLSPGRHAGPDGDIAAISLTAREYYPRLRISMAPLVGEHPELIGILADRVREARPIELGAANNRGGDAISGADH